MCHGNSMFRRCLVVKISRSAVVIFQCSGIALLVFDMVSKSAMHLMARSMASQCTNDLIRFTGTGMVEGSRQFFS